jgi:hypothetical protein
MIDFRSWHKADLPVPPANVCSAGCNGLCAPFALGRFMIRSETGAEREPIVCLSRASSTKRKTGRRARTVNVAIDA